ncbi:TetR/AcrR family transcriptional regulator [Amnibacterium flavum]|uniref:TetR family transcriptional regulator n=1 Tax=Amnibacterium flavum TaxID=2173173 RepID=A0A2V1HUF4_9MICO|nr:TetR/AcrR family transcriptional regulator [Amnibacterium flavum]PVZ94590.1 TetR family transcriptional regulator [Amnibacterium flavum]
MPKFVDHDQRREELIEVVWQLIATEGLEAVTTRRIAEVSGRANGTLLYYFPNKDAVITAAFRYTFDSTNRRADAADDHRYGLAGLRTLCLEIMPLDEIRLMEARIVLTFWQQAMSSTENADTYAGMMNDWRSEMTARIHEAQRDGFASTGLDVASTVDELLSMLMGLQVMSVLTPADTTPERQLAQLDSFMARLTA